MDKITIAPGTYQGQPFPSGGGSYERALDGSLTQTEKPTEPSLGKSMPATPVAPAAKKKGA